MGPAWPVAYARGRLELPVGLLVIVVIIVIVGVGRSRWSSRCIRPEALGQQAATHPTGHGKQTKAQNLQEATSTRCGGLVNVIEAMLDHRTTS